MLNPTYESLHQWVENLPETFATQGEVIYEERNQIRRIDDFVVKRFKSPWWQRTPKAQRSYENALRLQAAGIGTPEPVAYTPSFLVTKASSLKHNMYEFRNGEIAGKEDLIRAFAKFTAQLHNAGILHLDYSPGNILYDRVNGEWQFELVDINRMRFGKVSPKEGCYNLCRLWGKRDFFEVLSPVYARARGIEETQCLKWIMEARERFWAQHPHIHFVTDDSFTVGVIISTYNHPEQLEKALWGLKYQSRLADEIIVADDGSGESTRELIARYSDTMPIRHIWHEDKGFRKTTILNKAVEEAQSDYLIFIDQDLIARNDFIFNHCLYARRGHFISGGAVMIPKELSTALTEEDIRSGNAFRIAWLRQHGMRWNWKMSKLWSSAWGCKWLNRLTPARASWNGGNASTWREYILQAKGFDQRMRYGAEDREFGQRLENAGIQGIQLRYGTSLLHLWHERPYRNEEDFARNRAIWCETKKQRLTTTAYGIA